MQKLFLFTLIAALLLTGCGAPKPGITCLSETIPASQIEIVTEDRSREAADFGLRLFQGSLDPQGNTLVSPLSVLTALAMTANGAQGETLAQMEAVLGMSTDSMNRYLYGRQSSDTLKIANSIWFTDKHQFQMAPEFLDTNATFYQADLFAARMDEATRDAINHWVQEKTDGMIPQILDAIPDEAAAYLINALAFDAQWEKIYEEPQIQAGTFTKEDGTEQAVDLMYSKERQYLEDELATGFLKYYEGQRYAFLAMLPNEGVSVEAYVNSLTADHLKTLLEAPTDITVHAAIPKFDADFSTDLASSLSAMGMTDAFDGDLADFSAMGTSPRGNLCISRVLHKTHISVAEQGTQAGAATAVEMILRTSFLPEESRTVTLDRPFVYMLIDCADNLPIFMGSLMDAE